VTPEKPTTFEPKENVRLSYAKAQAQNVQMTINGKTIALPAAADFPNRNVIAFEVSKEKLQSIWESGQITASTAAPAPR
jgi:hypothetical protein